MENLLFLGVPILKHIRVHDRFDIWDHSWRGGKKTHYNWINTTCNPNDFCIDNLWAEILIRQHVQSIFPIQWTRKSTPSLHCAGKVVSGCCSVTARLLNPSGRVCLINQHRALDIRGVFDDNWGIIVLISHWNHMLWPLIWNVSLRQVFVQNWQKLSLITTKYSLLSRALWQQNSTCTH